jgi:hypothetical protein
VLNKCAYVGHSTKQNPLYEVFRALEYPLDRDMSVLSAVTKVKKKILNVL